MLFEVAYLIAGISFDCKGSCLTNTCRVDCRSRKVCFIDRSASDFSITITCKPCTDVLISNFIVICNRCGILYSSVEDIAFTYDNVRAYLFVLYFRLHVVNIEVDSFCGRSNVGSILHHDVHGYLVFAWSIRTKLSAENNRPAGHVVHNFTAVDSDLSTKVTDDLA